MNKRTMGLIVGMILLNLLLITMPMISKNMALKQKNRQLVLGAEQNNTLYKQEQNGYFTVSQLQQFLEKSGLSPLSEHIYFQGGFRYELILPGGNSESLKAFIQELVPLSPKVIIKEADIRFGEEEISSFVIESQGDGQ